MSVTGFYEYKGTLYTLDELSKKFNIKKRTLYARIKEKNWSIERAINTPIKKYGDASVELGKKFNYLTVLEIAGRSKLGRTTVKCICDCGQICIKEYTFIKNNQIKTCGKCNLALINSVHNRKDYHGKHNTRVYQSWRAMLNRCYNKNSVKYKNYGKRGIKVCEDWRNSFIVFYKWSIENGYNDNLTIDRIDVNGDYTPDNCRWVDTIVQANNKTNTVKIKYNDKLYTIYELATLLGTTRHVISGRYYRKTLDTFLKNKE